MPRLTRRRLLAATAAFAAGAGCTEPPSTLAQANAFTGFQHRDDRLIITLDDSVDIQDGAWYDVDEVRVDGDTIASRPFPDDRRLPTTVSHGTVTVGAWAVLDGGARAVERVDVRVAGGETTVVEDSLRVLSGYEVRHN